MPTLERDDGDRSVVESCVATVQRRTVRYACESRTPLVGSVSILARRVLSVLAVYAALGVGSMPSALAADLDRDHDHVPDRKDLCVDEPGGPHNALRGCAEVPKLASSCEGPLLVVPADGTTDALWVACGDGRVWRLGLANGKVAPGGLAVGARGLVQWDGWGRWTRWTADGGAPVEPRDAPRGSPVVMGALDRSLIDRVIKEELPKIRTCYQRELRASPGLSGKLKVRFTIAPDGTVSEVATESEVGDVVGECVADRFRAMMFPAPAGGGIVKVAYPFVFAPE